MTQSNGFISVPSDPPPSSLLPRPPFIFSNSTHGMGGPSCVSIDSRGLNWIGFVEWIQFNPLTQQYPAEFPSLPESPGRRYRRNQIKRGKEIDRKCCPFYHCLIGAVVSSVETRVALSNVDQTVGGSRSPASYSTTTTEKISIVLDPHASVNQSKTKRDPWKIKLKKKMPLTELQNKRLRQKKNRPNYTPRKVGKYTPNCQG